MLHGLNTFLSLVFLNEHYFLELISKWTKKLQINLLSEQCLDKSHTQMLLSKHSYQTHKESPVVTRILHPAWSNGFVILILDLQSKFVHVRCSCIARHSKSRKKTERAEFEKCERFSNDTLLVLAVCFLQRCLQFGLLSLGVLFCCCWNGN